MSRHAFLGLALVAALVGCRDRHGTREAPPATSAPSTSAPPASNAVPAMKDPWAAGAASPTLADTACPKVTAPYFYRIERDGKTSYMLGTRHIGVAMYKLPPIVVEKLKASKVFVSEVGPEGHAAQPAAAPPTPSLSEQLGPELWQRYRDLAGPKLAAEVEHEQPAAAMLRLVAMHEDLASALDNELEQVAKDSSIALRGLETSSFQDKLLRRWLDIRMLRAFVTHVDSLEELRQDTIDDLSNYCQGTDDTPGIDPKQRADMLDAGYTEAELAAFDRELLFDRNRDWIPKLEPILADGDAFIVVGADHLRGEQGVPMLLRAKGYHVARVAPPR